MDQRLNLPPGGGEWSLAQASIGSIEAGRDLGVISTSDSEAVGGDGQLGVATSLWATILSGKGTTAGH
jgi:hypothetical protein